jgi:uncharacterized protein (TIGR03382 family)
VKTSSNLRSRLFVTRGLLVAAVATASVAHASSFGISGYNGPTFSCSTCHNLPPPIPAPATIAITGPTTMVAESKANFTVTVTSAGATVAGFALSSNDPAVKFTAAVNTKVLPGIAPLGETITHSVGTPAANGSATWTFEVIAPKAGTGFQLLFAGLAGIADLNLTADNATAASTVNVAVTGGDPVVAPAPDAGTPAIPGGGGGGGTGPITGNQTPQPAAKAQGGPAVIYGDMGCTAAGAEPLLMLALATLVARGRRRAGR